MPYSLILHLLRMKLNNLFLIGIGTFEMLNIWNDSFICNILHFITLLLNPIGILKSVVVVWPSNIVVQNKKRARTLMKFHLIETKRTPFVLLDLFELV